MAELSSCPLGGFAYTANQRVRFQFYHSFELCRMQRLLVLKVNLRPAELEGRRGRGGWSTS